jgi:hypothetical protein
MGERWSSVVYHLPNMCEALSLILSTEEGEILKMAVNND